MTDDEMYQILEDFANSHTLAHDIVVEMTMGHTSFHAKHQEKGFRYEDGEMLSSLIRGAEHFMMWLRREGKARFVQKYTQKGAKPTKSRVLGRKKRHSYPKGDNCVRGN
jgi:shikimate 5-dehydrogenase